MKADQYDVGVIVGRFQVPELHPAHIDLIETVCGSHDKVIVFLGNSPLFGTRQNPMDFEPRKQMLLAQFPALNVLYIEDLPSDALWSKDLDKKIKAICTPMQKPVLYGGRDSFVKRYTGKYPTVELEPETYVAFSGADIRRQIARNGTKASPDFRAGMIFAAHSQHYTVQTTVDIAIISENGDKLLVGRKENEDKWRLIGGFTDIESDCFEQDARREVKEETGIEITDPKYVTSKKIDEWRYRPEIDRKITTVLYIAKHMYGTPRPADDIEAVKWITIADLNIDEIVPNHRVLVLEALEYKKQHQI